MTAARARVKFVDYPELGKDQPKRDFVPLADLVTPRGASAPPPIDPDVIEMWEPECVSCGTLMGYKAKVGRYVGQTICATCSAETLDHRLKSSGISFREFSAELDSLVSPANDARNADIDARELAQRESEFRRYLAFLHRFAALKPGERMKPPFAFVYGSLGTGKTAGTERAMRDAIRNGCSGRVVRFSDLVRKIYDTYRRAEASDKDNDRRDYSTEDVLRTYTSAHLLLIHEVGPDAESDHALGLFFDFVDDRLQAMLPTIFTANYAPSADSLGARIGKRATDDVRVRGIIDRIGGGVGENVFCLLGPSWRGHEPR